MNTYSIIYFTDYGITHIHESSNADLVQSIAINAPTESAAIQRFVELAHIDDGHNTWRNVREFLRSMVDGEANNQEYYYVRSNTFFDNFNELIDDFYGEASDSSFDIFNLSIEDPSWGDFINKYMYQLTNMIEELIVDTPRWIKISPLILHTVQPINVKPARHQNTGSSPKV